MSDADGVIIVIGYKGVLLTAVPGPKMSDARQHGPDCPRTVPRTSLCFPVGREFGHGTHQALL